MGKGKLAKFAEMAEFPHVVELPFPQPGEKISLRGQWAKEFFHNDNPIVLELGCGRGEYTVGLARRFPHKNFIGIDIKGARMWSGASEVAREGIKNAGFLRTRIEFIDRFFEAGEISEIWLTFSDPQMKKPTKRLTSTYFLERYRRFLADGGIVHVKTDSNFLYTYTQHVVSANNLPLEAASDDIYNNPNIEASLREIRTYYEQMWLSRGIPIKYLRFRLPATGQLEEPEVEIPFDEYRSYNRDKRSTLSMGK